MKPAGEARLDLNVIGDMRCDLSVVAACFFVTMAGSSQQAQLYHDEKEAGGENG